MITAIACLLVVAPAVDPWPMARQDRFGTGRALSGLAASSYSDAYVYRLMYSTTPESNLAAPVASADGKIYYPTNIGMKQYDAYTAKGITQRQYATELGYQYIPAINSAAALGYACSDGVNGGVTAYTIPTPVKVWQTKTTAPSGSPTLGPTGDVFVATRAGSLFRLNGQTGAIKWQRTGLVAVQGHPVFSRDDTMVIVTTNKIIRAFDPNTGEPLWTRALTANAGQAAVSPNGRIIVGAQDGSINCLAYQGGGKKWKVDTTGPVTAAPAFAADGTVYLGGSDGIHGMLYALNSLSGAILWSVPTDAPIVHAPSVGHDGRIYVSAGDELLAVRPDGSVIWKEATRQGTGPITIGPDSILYVGSNKGGMLIRQEPLRQEMSHAETEDHMMIEPDDDPTIRTVLYSIDDKEVYVHPMRLKPGSPEFAMFHVRFGGDMPQFKWVSIDMSTHVIHPDPVMRQVKFIDSDVGKFVQYDMRPETATESVTTFTFDQNAMNKLFGAAVHIRIGWSGSGDITNSSAHVNYVRVRWVPFFNIYSP